MMYGCPDIQDLNI
jgi:hypothetical protein